MQFRDLQKQYELLKTQIDAKVQSVCASAHYISGPEITELEKKLAEYVGVKHCITCANGTDALTLAVRAWGLEKGDAVFVPDFTFFSSGECPASEGCTCIFVDVDEHTYNMNPARLEQAIENVKAEGTYRPRAVVVVDLFGQPADFDTIRTICEKYDLLILEDGAQGFGGEIRGRRACSFGDIATTSFFPAKPLGCYGDGGAVFTDNDEWAALIRSYAVHGKAGDDKYNNIRLGLNSRLDTIQAAILQVKFEAFKAHEIADVNQVAKWYVDAFLAYGLGTKCLEEFKVQTSEKRLSQNSEDSKIETKTETKAATKVLEIRECCAERKVLLPTVKEGFLSSWAQYTIQLPAGTDRAALQVAMKEKGIPTMIYYAKPMHLQGAFVGTRSAEADCPVTERLCKSVLSLPMHPYMTKEQVEKVVGALRWALQVTS